MSGTTVATGRPSSDSLVRIDRRLGVGLLVVTALIYTLTIPQTRSEAEDAFWFATLVETEDWRSLPNLRHFLYLPLMRLVWNGVSVFAPTVRPYPVMVGAGIVLAAIAAWLFYLVARRFAGLSPAVAAMLTAGFALSRGSWRYAAEAEVYSLGAIGVLLFMLAFDSSNRRVSPRVILFGALAIACNALHVIAVVAIPAVAAWKESGWRSAIMPAATMLGVGLVVGGAMVGVLASDPEIGDEGLPAPDFAVVNAPVGIALLGSDVVAIEPLFAFEPVRNALGDLYPDAQLDEELGFGESLAIWHAWFGLAAIAGTASLIIALLIRFRSSARWANTDLTLLAWIGAFVFVGALFVADAPEPWILALIPLWLLFGRRIIAPAWDSGGVWKYVAIGTIGLVVLHNLVGGALPDMDASRDLGIVRGEWLVENADPSDLVITSNGLVFQRYLTYRGVRVAEVRDALTADEVDLIFDGLSGEPGRILVTGDLLTGDLGPHIRLDSDSSIRARELVSMLELELVHSDPVLDIYELTN